MDSPMEHIPLPTDLIETIFPSTLIVKETEITEHSGHHIQQDIGYGKWTVGNRLTAF